jgi:hypothetical protein
MNVKSAAVALAAVLALTVAACEPPPGTHGRVAHKWRVAKPLIFVLVVKQSDGTNVKVHPHRPAWRRCHIGDHYPQCTH